MGTFKLGGMTLGSLFKKPETVMYPLEVKPAPAGRKGHIENEVELCILCGLCQKACPCHAIEVDKKQRLWTINPFLCITCFNCMRACPKDCLDMNPAFTPITTKMEDIVCEVPEQPKA